MYVLQGIMYFMSCVCVCSCKNISIYVCGVRGIFFCLMCVRLEWQILAFGDKALTTREGKLPNNREIP